jgi:hypothetical protein
MTEQNMQIEGIEPTTNPLFWDYFVAQHTQKMRVGQVGMNLTVVNPIQLAENIAMLDHFVFPADLHSRLRRRWTERPAGPGTW